MPEHDELKQYIIKTRYRGSKTKVIPLIWNCTKTLNISSVLDCFGGTGSVSYFFKRQGKSVTYNDHLKFNHVIGRALIENDSEQLDDMDVRKIFINKPYSDHLHVIENNFKDIYYTNDENIWLDRVISNIYDMEPGYKQDMAFWCLFQSCIIKRPFSLFHRKNLNVRLRDVKRSFGNKSTWETPFDVHFKRFVNEINGYIYNSNGLCRSLSQDVKNIPIQNGKFDLVYIDPPYIPIQGENIIYRNLYHFLEGIMDYENWQKSIDMRSKHRRLIPEYNIWNDRKSVHKAFESAIKNFKDSTILISHRSDGRPTKEEIIEILKKYKDNVIIADSIRHKYALSHRNSEEILILAR